MLLRKPVLCADRAENTEIMATDHAKWADKSRKLRALFALFIDWNNIMRHAADDMANMRWSKGQTAHSPMANTRNVISDDVNLRVIWCELAYLWRNSADAARKKQ